MDNKELHRRVKHLEIVCFILAVAVSILLFQMFRVWQQMCVIVESVNTLFESVNTILENNNEALRQINKLLEQIVVIFG